MTIRRSTSRLNRRTQSKPGGLPPIPPGTGYLVTNTGALFVTDSGVEVLYAS